MYRKLVIILIAFTAIALSGCADGDGVEMNNGEETPFANLGVFSIERIEPSVASPGDEVTIFGPGLNADIDSVIAGNMELTVNSSIDVALSAITGEEESDTIDGQLRFTIREDAEMGTLPIKVVRGEMESNVVDIEIVAVDEGDDIIESGGDDADKTNSLSLAVTEIGRLGSCRLKKNNLENTYNSAANHGCNFPAAIPANYAHLYKVEWSVPEEAVSAKIRLPLTGFMYTKRSTHDDHGQYGYGYNNEKATHVYRHVAFDYKHNRQQDVEWLFNLIAGGNLPMNYSSARDGETSSDCAVYSARVGLFETDIICKEFDVLGISTGSVIMKKSACFSGNDVETTKAVLEIGYDDGTTATEEIFFCKDGTPEAWSGLTTR